MTRTPSSRASRAYIRSLTAAVVLLSLPGVCPAAAAEGPAAYERFVALREDGVRLEGREGTLEGNLLTGTSTTGQQIQIPRDELKRLYVAEGTEAGTGALIGGGIGLAIGISTLAKLSQYTDLNGAGLFTGLAATGILTAAGTLIGALTGASTPRWRIEPVILPGQQYSLLLTGPL